MVGGRLILEMKHKEGSPLCMILWSALRRSAA